MSSNREISCSLERLLNKLAGYTKGEKAIWSVAAKAELAFISGTVVFCVLFLWGFHWSRNANETSTKELLAFWIVIFLLLFCACFCVSLGLEIFRLYNRSEKLSREYSSYSLTEAVKDQENARDLLKSFHPETIILAEEHIKYLVKKLQISKDNSSSSLTVLSFLLLVVGTALFVNIPQLIEIVKQKYLGDFLGKNKIFDIVSDI